MTVTDQFRTSRTGDAPWEVLAGASMTGGAVTFGDARLPGRTSGPALHVHSRGDEQAAYVATLTGPPDHARLDQIGTRWGVARLGPPLRGTSRADDDRFGGAQNA
jgi:hypothetical protein